HYRHLSLRARKTKQNKSWAKSSRTRGTCSLLRRTRSTAACARSSRRTTGSATRSLCCWAYSPWAWCGTWRRRSRSARRRRSARRGRHESGTAVAAAPGIAVAVMMAVMVVMMMTGEVGEPGRVVAPRRLPGQRPGGEVEEETKDMTTTRQRGEGMETTTTVESLRDGHRVTVMIITTTTTLVPVTETTGGGTGTMSTTSTASLVPNGGTEPVAAVVVPRTTGGASSQMVPAQCEARSTAVQLGVTTRAVSVWMTSMMMGLRRSVSTARLWTRRRWTRGAIGGVAETRGE
ncbi:hypothetical protein Micbo1qcDRAFT_217097, partial [Microdochium bolleyi]